MASEEKRMENTEIRPIEDEGKGDGHQHGSRTGYRIQDRPCRIAQPVPIAWKLTY